uniref:Transmembrane protein n=1 Tax=Steinernema glaseri TaxID=37863 RepID=A0A1I7YPF1_9BILA
MAVVPYYDRLSLLKMVVRVYVLNGPSVVVVDPFIIAVYFKTYTLAMIKPAGHKNKDEKEVARKCSRCGPEEMAMDGDRKHSMFGVDKGRKKKNG